MLRWILFAVLLWLAILTVLTLIAIFRHSSSQHSTVACFTATVVRPQPALSSRTLRGCPAERGSWSS
jgi:hypothetical protein